MTFGEWLACLWITMILAALAYSYVLSYLQPNRNGLTRFVTNWSNRKYDVRDHVPRSCELHL